MIGPDHREHVSDDDVGHRDLRRRHRQRRDDVPGVQDRHLIVAEAERLRRIGDGVAIDLQLLIGDVENPVRDSENNNYPKNS